MGQQARTAEGYALDMTGVSKRFGRNLVLDDVTFRVRPGSVHGLVGHNGAGKSTLMKIALGAVEPTAGTVSVGGTPLTFSRPAGARDAGVGMVLQELSLIPTLSVADNIFLNDERLGRLRTISGRRERLQASELLRQLGITTIRPTRMVGELGIAEQQMVEIAKAVRLSRKLLILDEPTAPLARQEVLRLFDLVRRTAALGIGVVFVTHHLREIFEICDEISVMREGRVVQSGPTGGTTLGEVVVTIVGRELATDATAPAHRAPAEGPPLLEAEHLVVPGKLADVSFELRQGEILGIAGLAASGRSVLLKTLFGEIRPAGGSVRLRGERFAPRDAAGAIARGVYLIPEDRRRHGAVLAHTIEQNVVLSILRRVTRSRIYRPRIARRLASGTIRELNVQATGLAQPMQELSGGNQQKIVLAKALLAEPRVFLLDEPTFGVDVHAAAEIIRRMRREAEAGRAILWVSSDLTELLQVSDRILVLSDGVIRAVVARGSGEFTEEAMLRGIQRRAAAS
jgi:ribose transport system ATP-binding protein